MFSYLDYILCLLNQNVITLSILMEGHKLHPSGAKLMAYRKDIYKYNMNGVKGMRYILVWRINNTLCFASGYGFKLNDFP